MGGNALSYPSVRLNRSDYLRIADQCVDKLRELYPRNRVHVIDSYRAKETFGDLDILVESTAFDPFLAAGNLSAFEVVRNGPVTSVGIKLDESKPDIKDNLFQVDLIAMAPAPFDYAKNYFAFNDLGNLIGRTAHKMGLCHGHDGLWFYLREGDYLFRDILLTQDHDTALKFLGYSPEVFSQGFNELEDIFLYVANSKFFNRDIFLLDNRNHASRVRDRKRKTYMEFLKWAEARPDLPKFEYPESKSSWLPSISEHFPHFTVEYDAAMQGLHTQRAVKVKYNGSIVGSLTGLEGKQLGLLMKRVRESFSSQVDMQQFILTVGQEELFAYINSMRKEAHL